MSSSSQILQGQNENAGLLGKARLTSRKLFLSTFLSTLQNQLDKNFPVLYLPTIVTC